jgi:phosphoglycerol transferase
MVSSAPLGTMNGKARALAAYAAGAAASCVAAFVLLELWRADLRVPFDYGGDGLLFSIITKTTVDRGWFWTNPSLGAPAGFSFYDYPVSANDTAHLLVIKGMSLFCADWAVLFNTYFLLGFPLTTLSAMAVFRQFGIGFGPAAAGAILYSFLPSRLLKGEGHIFLDVFYQVPLAILVVLWVCGPTPPLLLDRHGGKWPKLEVRRARSWCSLLICALVASTSLYYAFFTVCLLVAGGAWAAWQYGTIRNALSGLLLAGTITAALAANALPSIVYQAQHGPNHAVAQRRPQDAEIFGMKIAQLLLPTDGHRITPLRDLKARYNMGAPLGGESGATSLGFVGGVGFLLLLGSVLSGRRGERPPDDCLRPLGVLNLMAVLLGTIGGFGSLIAWLVTPQIRTYSRINVLIGFFAFFAIAILLERLRRRSPRVALAVVPLVLLVGLLDQVTPYAVKAYEANKLAYRSDADLVQRVEAAMPSGAIVLELPFMAFPDVPPLRRLDTYASARPYLHSRTLRWSYPVMQGRQDVNWVVGVSRLEPPAMLEALTGTDVGGILVQREGYLDNGAGIENAFRALLGTEPLVSEDGRLAFFSIRRSPAAPAR